MKKRFLRLCCALLAVAMLAGCSSSPNGTSATGESKTGSAPESGTTSETGSAEEVEPLTEQTLPISEEKVTLSYWRVWSNDYTPDFNEYQVNKEMEEKTNVKIELAP